MMEEAKKKAPAFEETERWWVFKRKKTDKWIVTPPLNKIHHPELHGEFTRHDAALAFAVAEANQ